jgi:hypothetical protein
VAAASESLEGRLLRANLRPHPRALIGFHHCLSRLEVSPATPTTPFLLSSRPQQALLLLLGVVPTSFIIASSPARPPPHGFSPFSQRQVSTSTALQLNATQHPTTSVPSHRSLHHLPPTLHHLFFTHHPTPPPPIPPTSHARKEFALPRWCTEIFAVEVGADIGQSE